MGYTELNSAVRDEFGTLVQDPLALRTIYDNQPQPEPGEETLWARVTVLVADSQQITRAPVNGIGSARYHRRPGVVVVQVFGEPEGGSGDVLETVDAVDVAFRSRTLVVSGGPTITFRSARLGDPLRERHWFRRNLEIPFFADEVL